MTQEQWPEKWLFTRRVNEPGGTAAVVTGEGMRQEANGSFTYFCLCGAEINRFEGERNDEVQAWVELHNRPFAPLTHIDVDADVPT